jgi:spore coat-associated protein N
MSIKKRLGLGAMSAVMGISLIGTGTWAAFNDIESVQAKVGAGELNLNLAELNNGPIDFKISDLKPGDFMTRNIVLQNTGSLAIKDVLMSIESVDFTDYIPAEGEAGYGDNTHGTNTAIEYLNQFRVSVIKVGAEGGSGGFPKELISATKDVRLGEFYLASGTIGSKNVTGVNTAAINAAVAKVWGSVDHAYIDTASKRINGATINPNEWTGLPVVPHDDDTLQIKIEFVEAPAKNSDGTYVQNKFQGDTADIEIQFEARQWGGLDVKDSDMTNTTNGTGAVETNKKANSQN